VNKTLTVSEVNSLINTLWAPLADGSKPNVYMVLDGARDKRIEPLINNSKVEQSCLYAGKLSYALKRAAPHIVKLNEDSSFTAEILTLSWRKSWGIFFITPSNVSMAAVRSNCRKISKVQTPTGKVLVFRYQDPRVLRKFLPLCDSQQLRQVFGNASVIAMENEQANQLIRYNFDSCQQKLSSQLSDVHIQR
jgi:hypothetical protein